MKQDYLYLALSIAVLAILAGRWLMQRARLQRARSWPTTPGSVDATDVRLESRGGYQSKYVGEVKYSYKLNGEANSGFVRREFMRASPAEKWTGVYPQGRPLIIRYNPANAKDSVMDERDQSPGK